jgi:hypothetical protein
MIVTIVIGEAVAMLSCLEEFEFEICITPPTQAESHLLALVPSLAL